VANVKKYFGQIYMRAEGAFISQYARRGRIPGSCALFILAAHGGGLFGFWQPIVLKSTECTFMLFSIVIE
jgi:hypothetical protein